MNASTTLPSILAIPTHIWTQDQAIWKDWLASRNVSWHTKQENKRFVTRFYAATEKPIAHTTEDDLRRFEEAMRADGLSEHTIKNRMQPVRAYWLYAQPRKQAQA